MSAAVSLPMSETPVRHYHHWSEREENLVRHGWGHAPIEEIAKQVGRTPRAVYRFATEIGLGAGCPNGFEYLTHAARRTGFARGTMRRLLNWARVPIRVAASVPGSKGREHIVETWAVDRAVERWCSTETVEHAGNRLGYSPCTVVRLLEAARDRGEIELPPRAYRTQWRVDRSVVDSVVAKHMARESVTDAARRVGVSLNSLKVWLAQAGVTRPPGGRWWVNGAEIDRVVEAKRAAGCKVLQPKTKNGEA